MSHTASQRNGVSRRFLFTTWDGGGNLPPVIAVAKRLVQAGHRIRFLGDPCHELEVRSSGGDFVSWQDAPKRVVRRPETDQICDWEVSRPDELIARLRDRLFFGPAAAYARDVRREMGNFDPDCIVTSDMLFGPAIAAEAGGVPCVMLSANVFLFPRPGVPPFGPGFAPASTPAEEERDRQIEAMTRELFGVATGRYNEARAEFGLAPLKHPFEQLERVSSILMLTSEHFDFVPSEENPRFVYAGPELDDPVWCGSWTNPWREEDDRPLVLVGLSSTFQNQREVIERIIHALSTLEVRAVVTTGPEISPSDVGSSPNIVVRQTAPHSRILPEASVMITHCGHGSVMRGLAAGVPLLCLPMGRDHNDNAARVEHRNAGIRLAPDTSADAIADAVRRLLKDPSFRDSARRLGEKLRDDARRSRAVSELERWAAAREERAANRISAAA